MPKSESMTKLEFRMRIFPPPLLVSCLPYQSDSAPEKWSQLPDSFAHAEQFGVEEFGIAPFGEPTLGLFDLHL